MTDHEAEETLTRKEFDKYKNLLYNLCKRSPIRTTASQRAEAFLRTKGLWKE